MEPGSLAMSRACLCLVRTQVSVSSAPPANKTTLPRDYTVLYFRKLAIHQRSVCSTMCVPNVPYLASPLLTVPKFTTMSNVPCYGTTFAKHPLPTHSRTSMRYGASGVDVPQSPWLRLCIPNAARDTINPIYLRVDYCRRTRTARTYYRWFTCVGNRVGKDD